MTTQQDLRALAERVMALPGEETHATLSSLEHNISAALGVWWMPDSQVAGPWLRSLDAAMTLVPEGFRVMLSDWDEKELRALGPWQSIVEPSGYRGVLPGKNEGRCDHAATPALALTAAALLARAEQMDAP